MSIDKKMFIDLYESNVPSWRMAEILGLASAASVRAFASALGLKMRGYVPPENSPLLGTAEERYIELARQWLAGVPAQRIATDLGYSDAGVVRARAHMLGLPNRRQKEWERRKKKFCQLWNEMRSAEDIRQSMGYKDVSTVYERARRYGCKKRPHGMGALFGSPTTDGERF